RHVFKGETRQHGKPAVAGREIPRTDTRGQLEPARLSHPAAQGGISTGSPVLSTTTVLGLALATAAISASWLGASELTSSALAAPLSSANTKATLAELAAATA